MRRFKKGIYSFCDVTYFLNLPFKTQLSGAFPDSVKQGPLMYYLFTKYVFIAYSTSDTISDTIEKRMITTQFLPSRGSQARKTRSYNGPDNKGLHKTPHMERCLGPLWSPMVFRICQLDVKRQEQKRTFQAHGQQAQRPGRWRLCPDQVCFPDLLKQCLTRLSVDRYLSDE